MFVVVADIKLKPELESEFKEWFSESNKIVSGFQGFVSRRLLQAIDGHHSIIVEFESKDDFEKMHQSEEHSKLHMKARTFMETIPSPKFYTVVAS